MYVSLEIEIVHHKITMQRCHLNVMLVDSVCSVSAYVNPHYVAMVAIWL